MKSKTLRQLAKNEAGSWEKIQALRKEFNPQTISQIRVSSNTQAMDYGREVIDKTLGLYRDRGLNVEESEPGQGSGHLT